MLDDHEATTDAIDASSEGAAEPAGAVFHRGYRYRLYPTPDEERELLAWRETMRRVWNVLMGMVVDAVRAEVAPRLRYPDAEALTLADPTGPTALERVRDDGGRFKREVRAMFKARGWTTLGLTRLCRAKVKELRASNPFCKVIGSSVLDEVSLTFVRAWSSYFAGLTKMPTFKRREDAVAIACSSPSAFRVKEQRVSLSLLQGRPSYREHRPLPSQPSRVSIQRSGGRWFVSFGVKVKAAPAAPADTIVAIDRGVANLLADSDGRFVNGLRGQQALERKRLRLERRIAKSEKGSKRRLKRIDQLARVHQRIVNTRNDLLHKESLHYARAYRVVVLEQLAVANMTRSARGTQEAPGTRVAQKAGLNRSILAQGWSRFDAMVAYKLEQRGGLRVYAAAAYSSQECAACGHTDAASRPTQSEFRCTACGHTDHADINASKVLRRRYEDSIAPKGDAPTHAGEATKKAPKKLASVKKKK
jgi:putative transposase